MSELLPTRHFGSLPSRSERRIGKALDRLGTQTHLDVAKVGAAEAVEVAKVEALAAVTTTALIEAGNLSAMEAAMFERAPHAGPRLKFIADSGAAAMAEVVVSMGRRMR